MIENELTISRLAVVSMMIIRYFRNVLRFVPINAAKDASVVTALEKNRNYNK